MTQDLSYIAAMMAELMEVQCVMECYKAANIERKQNNLTIAYGEKAFEDLAVQCRRIQNDIWQSR